MADIITIDVSALSVYDRRVHEMRKRDRREQHPAEQAAFTRRHTLPAVVDWATAKVEWGRDAGVTGPRRSNKRSF